MTQKSIHDADALLIYRVGPVLCCSPTLTVESVIMPPHMTQTPGASVAEPGVFKAPQGIIKAVDLRKRFGVDRNDWVMPGRIIITEIEGGYAGMWVDEIMDVIQSPSEGWRGVPSCVPKDVFTRTLLMDDGILLYADFEKLYHFKESGYLRQHIENIKNKEEMLKQAENKKNDSRLKTKDIGFVKSKRYEDKNKIKSNTESGSINHPNIEANKFEDRHLEKRNNIISDRVRTELRSHGSDKLKATDKSDYKLSARASSDKPKLSIKSLNLDQRNEVVDKLVSNNSAVERDEKELARSPKINDRLIVTEESESFVWGFVFVGILVIAVGAFGIFALFPDVDESSNLIESEIIKKTNKDKWNEYKSSTVVDIEEAGVGESVIEAAVLDSALEKKQAELEPEPESGSGSNASNEAGNYQADIMEDDEGLVIVLSDSFEIDREIEDINKQDQPESANDLVRDDKQDQPENSYNLKRDDKQEITGKSQQSTISSAVSNENNKAVKQLPVKDKINSVSKIKKQKKSENLVITHIVVKGDTLWHIAMRYIHNPYRYPELARLSHIKNPDLIYPGDKVKIIYKK